jgi:hypothetical protein
MISLSKEMKDILRLLNELTDHNLTNWEAGFVDDMRTRVILYGNRIIISEAQGAQLDKLADKYDLART